MAHLVTGYKGEEHIKSSDDGSFNASFFGNGQYVMEAGNQIYASIIDNNTIRVKDGDLLMHGRHIRIETNTYENMTIETGTAGTNRYDLIVMTYEKNASTGKEEARLEVIKGTASTSPTVPSYTKGNILEGAMKNQMPLYKVYIEGVVLKSIECLFTTIPTYKALAEQAIAEFETSEQEAEARYEASIADYVAEVQEIKKSVGDGKILVANAITDMGVATATDATFATMATNISNIIVADVNNLVIKSNGFSVSKSAEVIARVAFETTGIGIVLQLKRQSTDVFIKVTDDRSGSVICTMPLNTGGYEKTLVLENFKHYGGSVLKIETTNNSSIYERNVSYALTYFK